MHYAVKKIAGEYVIVEEYVIGKKKGWCKARLAGDTIDELFLDLLHMVSAVTKSREHKNK